MSKYYLKFDDDRCKGCGLCVNFCPRKILELDETRINKQGYPLVNVTDPDKCIGCAHCAIICPDSVIEVYKNE
ncbi:MAG: 4Fe-4S binding protein [Acholeplasmataceae bacterium]|jgi:2-oxoglutarate ferredoxin oxidoreductase subunit delta